MDKKFAYKVTHRAARPRSKRLRQQGIGGAASGETPSVAVAGGTGGVAQAGDGHTHSNLQDLEKLSVDGEGYVNVSRYVDRENEETGEEYSERVTEKAKAGYADEAGGLTEDSPVWEALRKLFLSKTADDTAAGLITFLKGLVAAGKVKANAGIELGAYLAGASGAAIDEAGAAELGALALRGLLAIGKYVSGKSGASITADGAAELESLLLRQGIRTTDFSAGALGTGFCLRKDENGDSYLEVDRMLVRKAAEFVQLAIQELKHVGGQIVLTPASMKCTRVEDTGTTYRCYFEATDGERTINNEFVPGDQARCQTFNIKEGTSANVSNTYYWRLVSFVGDDYIELSKTDCDEGSTAPAAGDEIVQLGNRTDDTRQAAIILASHGEDAPYIKMYRGISSYSLSGKEFFTVSRTRVEITADTLKFSTGEGVKDYIDNATGTAIIKVDVEYALGDSPDVAPASGWQTSSPQWTEGKYVWQRTATTTSRGTTYSNPACIQGAKGEQGIPGTNGTDGKTYYLHIAYATSADGSQGFSTTDAAGKAYIGTCTDTTQADPTDHARYAWSRTKGDTGRGVSALEEQYYLSTSDTVQTGGEWAGFCPEWQQGKYIWTRSKVTWTDNTVSYTAPVLAGDVNGLGEKLEEALSSLTENIEFANALSDELEQVKKQVDGAIETWFYDPVPTLSNAPASSWTTAELKNQHLGDLYYDGGGNVYRFQMSGSNYVWQVITDTDITLALANAKKAQDTADGKRRVFVATPTNASAYDVGDLWVNATYGNYTNDLLRCKTAKAANAAWSIGHWEKASKYTDDTKANQAIQDAAAAQAAANKAQATANNAQSAANAANSLLSDMASDNKLTAQEKQQAKKEWDAIAGEKPKNNASAVQFGVPTSAYDAAYNALNSYITPLLSSLTTTSDITGTEFRAKWKAYYDARTDLLNAISAKAKALADQAQQAAEDAMDAVNNIEIGGRNLIAGSQKMESSGLDVSTLADKTENGYNNFTVVHYNYIHSQISTNYIDIVRWNYYTISRLKPNTTYTLSFWCKGTGRVLSYLYPLAVLEGVNIDGTTTVASDGSISTNLTDDWRRVWIKWKTRSDIAGTSLLPIRCQSIDTELWVCGFKFEEGNVATDWTPAPEDTALAIQEALETADAAQEAADTAVNKANEAANRLNQWASDSYISPTEKLALKQERQMVAAEKDSIVADAAKYGVSSTDFVSKWAAYDSELAYHSTDNPENIQVRASFATSQSAYYSAYKTINGNIATAAKKLTTDLAENLDSYKSEVTAKFEATDNKISSAVTSSKEYTNEVFENIQIGGRNLIKNSKLDNSNKWSFNGVDRASFVEFDGYTCLKVTQVMGGVYASRGDTGNAHNVPLDGQVANSVDVYATEACSIQVGVESISDITIKVTEANKWVRVHGIQTLDGTSHSYVVYLSTNGVTAYFKNVKCEIGNKATDWTPAPEDLEEDVFQAQEAADAAQDAANQAKSVADAATARLNNWAADGTISPTEKPGLKDEISRVDADKTQITNGYTKYGLGTPTAYNNAYTAYRAQLVSLTAVTPENITIPSTFRANQTTYYTQRSTALNAISSAAKDYAEDIVDNVNIGGENILLNTKAFGTSTIVNGGLRNSSPTQSETYRGLAVRGTVKSSTALIAIAEYNLTEFDLGEEFTFSFYVKGTGGKVTTYFYGETGYVLAKRIASSDGQSPGAGYGDGHTVLPVTEDWRRVWVTWQLASTGYTSIKKYALIRLDQTTVGGTVYVCGCKLERGNKATAWSPSSLDADLAIDEVEKTVTTFKSETESRLDVMDGQISLKVSTEQLTQTKTEILNTSQGYANTAKQDAITTAGANADKKYATITTVTNMQSSITTLQNSITAQSQKITTVETSLGSLSTRVTAAEAKITPEAIKLTVSEMVENRRTVTLDASALDEDTYYPVTVGLPLDYKPVGMLLFATLGDGDVPGWSSHKGGFSLQIEWRENGGGYGTIPVRRSIYKASYQWTKTGIIPAGNIGQIQENSEAYFYVRGGGRYTLTLTGNERVLKSAVTLRPEGYTYTHPTSGFSKELPLLDSVSMPVPDMDQRPTEEEIKAGITLDGFGVSVFGKKIDFTGRVTFSSLAGDAQQKIDEKATTAAVSTAKQEAISAAARDAQQKADAAKSSAISAAATDAAKKYATTGAVSTVQAAANAAKQAADAASSSLSTLRNNLGDLAYSDLVGLAMLDDTVIEGGHIRTALIDAQVLFADHAFLDRIQAIDITTGRLTVTDGGRVAGFVVDGESLRNADGMTASIGVQYTRSVSGKSTDFLAILGYQNPLAPDSTGTAGWFQARGAGANVALRLVARESADPASEKGAADKMENYAIVANGGVDWMPMQNDFWRMPGVLFIARLNGSGYSYYDCWGDGCGARPAISRISEGVVRVTHNLGHGMYVPMAMAQNGPAWTICNISDLQLNHFDIHLFHKDQNEVDANVYFAILGYPKYG